MLHKDVDVCDAFISSLIELRVRVQENFANNLLYSSEEKAGSCTLIDRAIAQRRSGVAQAHAAGIGKHDGYNPSPGECRSEAVQKIRRSFIALMVLRLESFQENGTGMKAETMDCGI
jgi:hypothetical protein